MKKIVLLLIMLSLTSSVYAFSDTQNHWAKDYIDWGSNNEIINGYEDGTFKPNDKVKVNEFLKMLVEASKYKIEVTGKRWPDWYIATAKKYNWIQENEFDSYEKNITRDEVVRIVSRYINLTDVNKSKTKLSDLNSDNKDNVLKLINLGVVSGYEDNTFRGDSDLTRAEAIKIIRKSVLAREECISGRKYKLSNDSFNYTNIGKEQKTSLYPNRYEIKNNRLVFYDTGRYAKLDGYKIKSEYINETKVIELLNNLVSEDSYTTVSYVPDENIINQLIISHGEREGYMYRGVDRFSFTFYENKPYNLKYVTKQETFSDNCFLKIEVHKLWVWEEDLNNKTYVNEYKLERLKKCIGVLLGEDVQEEFGEYISEKVAQAQQKANGEKIVQKREIGKYVIDTYMNAGTKVEFYISKK